jgi:hypothetical protein
MKKYFLRLLCLFVFPQIGNSQTYIPFPENVAVWDIYLRPSEPDLRETRFNRYTMDGDTVIGGKTYNKIYCSSYVYTYPPQKLTITKLGYCFGIRQDIATKRVYRTLSSNNTTIDTLLFDFNLQIGDTVTRTFTTRPSNANQVVTSIDSITFSGKKYKRFHLKGTMSDAALIEGVGSTNGLIEYNEGSFEAANLLSAFCNSEHSDCSTPLALNIQEADDDIYPISVFPNPASDYITIRFKNEVNKYNIILTDVLGKEILQLNGNGKEVSLSRNQLKNGVYLLKVADETHITVKKIIFQ